MKKLFLQLATFRQDVHVVAGGDPAVRPPDGATAEQHEGTRLPDSQIGERAQTLAAALGIPVSVALLEIFQCAFGPRYPWRDMGSVTALLVSHKG